MPPLVMALGALVALGLLVMASAIAWEAAKDLRYTHRLDDWGRDVAPWS